MGWSIGSAKLTDLHVVWVDSDEGWSMMEAIGKGGSWLEEKGNRDSVREGTPHRQASTEDSSESSSEGELEVVDSVPYNDRASA